MINKILKLKNLGRLNIPTNDISENKNDDFSFKKNTLIFGDNTYGKTTLVSVFKSLQTGESLENRKKFRSQNSIEIKIENFKEGQVVFHEYNKESWKNNNILIFDNDFIKDHILNQTEINMFKYHFKPLNILTFDETMEYLKRLKSEGVEALTKEELNEEILKGDQKILKVFLDYHL